jgi:hypothetical protein
MGFKGRLGAAAIDEAPPMPAAVFSPRRAPSVVGGLSQPGFSFIDGNLALVGANADEIESVLFAMLGPGG